MPKLTVMPSASSHHLHWLDKSAFLMPKDFLRYTKSYQQRFNSTLFSQLVAELNVRATPIGLDFSSVPRRFLNPSGLPTGRRVSELLEAASPDASSKIFFEEDEPQRHVAKSKLQHDTAEAAHLREHGYVSIADWNLDIAKLSQQCEAHLSQKREKHGGRLPPITRIVDPSLPELRKLLINATVAKLLRSYLGEKVRYDGHVLLRLGDGVTREGYKSAEWHHDRCSRTFEGLCISA